MANSISDGAWFIDSDSVQVMHYFDVEATILI